MSAVGSTIMPLEAPSLALKLGGRSVAEQPTADTLGSLHDSQRSRGTCGLISADSDSEVDWNDKWLSDVDEVSSYVSSYVHTPCSREEGSHDDILAADGHGGTRLQHPFEVAPWLGPPRSFMPVLMQENFQRQFSSPSPELCEDDDGMSLLGDHERQCSSPSLELCEELGC